MKRFLFLAETDEKKPMQICWDVRLTDDHTIIDAIKGYLEENYPGTDGYDANQREEMLNATLASFGERDQGIWLEIPEESDDAIQYQTPVTNPNAVPPGWSSL